MCHLCFSGPAAMAYGLTDKIASSLSTEYGSLCVTVEVVSSVDAAVRHIHEYGRFV